MVATLVFSRFDFSFRPSGQAWPEEEVPARLRLSPKVSSPAMGMGAVIKGRRGGSLAIKDDRIDLLDIEKHCVLPLCRRERDRSLSHRRLAQGHCR
jgi:hypothetical protein